MKFQSFEFCWEMTVYGSDVPGHSPYYFVCYEIETVTRFFVTYFLFELD